MLSCLVFFCGVILIVFFTASHMEKEYKPTLIEDMLYLPSGKFLKGAALAYDEMLADVLWIKAIGYYGGHAKTDQDYRWLHHIITVITILDPLFQYPYEFGGVVMAAEMGQVDNSLAILQKGMENIPKAHKRYWYLPFFTAFNYMYYKQDYKKAAAYLEIASKFPGSPKYLPLLTARLYANTDSSDSAIPFFCKKTQTTESEELKAQLIKRLYTLISLRNIQFLENAKENFFSAFQRYPETLDALVSAGIITQIPSDPLKGKYYLSLDDNIVKSTIMPEKLKVHSIKPAQ